MCLVYQLHLNRKQSIMEEAFIELMDTDMSCQDILIDCIKDKNLIKESSNHLLLNDDCFEELSTEYHHDMNSAYKEGRFDLKVDTNTIFVTDFHIERKADLPSCYRNATSRSDNSRNMHTDQVDISEDHWVMSKEFKEKQQCKNSFRDNVIEEDADLWELIESLNDTDNFSGSVKSFDYALDLIEPTLEILDSNIMEKYSHIFSQRDIMEEDILDSQTFLEVDDFYDREMLTKCKSDPSFDFCSDLSDLWEDDFIDIGNFFQSDSSFTENVTQYTSFKAFPTLSDSESMGYRPVSDNSFRFSDSLVTSDVSLFPLPDPLFTSSDPAFTANIPQLKASDHVFRATDPVNVISDQIFTAAVPLLTASMPMFTSPNPIDTAIPPFTALEPVFTATVPLVRASNPVFTTLTTSDSGSIAPVPTLASDLVSAVTIPLVTSTACDPVTTASMPIITVVDPTYTNNLTASDPVSTATMPLLTASNHFLTHYSHNNNHTNLAKPKSVHVLDDNGQSIMIELKQSKMPNPPTPRDLNHLKLTNKTSPKNTESNFLQQSDIYSRMTRVDPDSYQNVTHIPVSQSMMLNSSSQNLERSPIDKSNNNSQFDPSRCECPRINLGMGDKFVSVRIRDILYKNVRDMTDCFREKQHKNVNELTKEWKETYKLLRERKIKRLNSEKTSLSSSSNS